MVNAQCAVPQPASAPDVTCYNQTIANDSWCCNNSWDGICQSAYDACAPSGSGPCSSITPIIGCGTAQSSSMSGTGAWSNLGCGWSTPGVESIWSFTPTTSGNHSINVQAISGGFIDIMWINSSSGCAPGAGWNCVDDVFSTGTYGTMNWIAGQTYYILLDPETTGATNITFSVTCPNPSGYVSGDCPGAIPICSNANFAIDPSGFGTVDELCTYCTSNPGTNPVSANQGCLNAGELHSTWLQVNVLTAGTLEFSFGAPGGGFTCYDWIMWPYNAATCAGIASNTLPPVRCNWNGNCDGYTGISNTLPAGGFASNFEPAVNAAANSQYMICLSNYSSNYTNLPLDFFGTAGISCTPLSVEMTNLSAQGFDYYNLINWSTLTEINSDYFEVQRGTESENFVTIGTVLAEGTTFEQQDYSFADYERSDEIVYYRIKQVDVNGGIEFTEVVKVIPEGYAEFKLLEMYPNPTDSKLNIRLHSVSQKETRFSVHSLNGNEVMSKVQSLNKGENVSTLDLGALTSGVYMLVIQDADGTILSRERVVVN